MRKTCVRPRTRRWRHTQQQHSRKPVDKAYGGEEEAVGGRGRPLATQPTCCYMEKKRARQQQQEGAIRNETRRKETKRTMNDERTHKTHTRTHSAVIKSCVSVRRCVGVWSLIERVLALKSTNIHARHTHTHWKHKSEWHWTWTWVRKLRYTLRFEKVRVW